MVDLMPSGVETVENRLWACLNDQGVEFVDSASDVVRTIELTSELWGELGATFKVRNILSHICSRLHAADHVHCDRKTRSKIDRVRVKACLLARRLHVLGLS